MSDPRAPRRGRHAFPEGQAAYAEGHGAFPGAQGSSAGPGTWWDATSPGFPTPRPASYAAPERSSWSPEETAAWTWDSDDPRWDAPPPPQRGSGRGAHAAPPERGGAGHRHASGLLDRWPDETGPLTPDEDGRPGLAEWRHRPGEDAGAEPVTDRPGGRSAQQPADDAAGPSLPPRPSGVWSRLGRRSRRSAESPAAPRGGRDAEPPTVDQETVSPVAVPGPADADTHHLPADWADRTGALDVIGAHVGSGPPDDDYDDDVDGYDVDGYDADGYEYDAGGHVDVDGYDDYDDYHDYAQDADEYDADGYDGHGDDDHTGPLHLRDDDIPIAPYDPRTRRRRRRPLAIVLSLLVLAGIAVGVVFGGQKVLGLFVARDYTGTGTGTVQVRVHSGDTLSDIGQTLVDADVIASVRPFVTAAEKDPRATGIAPGLYALHHHISGQAAVRLLLDPKARLVTRVTIPEGLTAKKTLDRLAQVTGVPLEQLQAAAANPAALGLPPYANGQLEGFLFPATYDFEPGTTPTVMLKTMVARAVQTLDQLQIPADQRLSVVTEASIVQAEAGSLEDMPKVARVLDNRLAKGMPLQLDTTVNYANGKSGLTTTPQDRANPSPYNTYLHPGLPPGPISDPGEEALKAVLSPAAGDWLYFVVVNPDTGETRFAATAQEHQQNVALFQQWLRAHPNG